MITSEKTIELPTINITVSELASSKITELIETNAAKKNLDKDTLFLRVYVAGGGCSGVQYGMALTSDKREDDETVQVSDIKIIVDPMSKTYLDGATVDFIDHELGARFKISPPENLQQGGGCSCGSGGGCC
jgi:iron-sulfur cluster assembly protein